jgi:peptidyl-dipeptidase A
MHYRTVRERYGPAPAGLERLARARELLADLVLFGSGDLHTVEAAARMYATAGVDGVTPARGLVANPWLLRDIEADCRGAAVPARTEAEFDPGAKYHVPANVPYTRYFLADVLQFQFHRALCRAAGQPGPLHRCSIYGSKEAGQRLQKMLEMGQSRPWPEALEALTGEREMDATANLDYFAPLKKWLDEQNAGQPAGW